VIALLAAARAVHFASLMMIFGASAYTALLERAGLPSARWRAERTIFGVAAILALGSAILWFCLIAGQMSGDWRSSIDVSTLKLVAADTRFGRIFTARFLGLIALVLMYGAIPARRGVPIAILSGALLASLAPISHAAADAGPMILGVASDAAHLLTAGFWLGGLIVLAMLALRHWNDRETLIRPLRLFSLWGSFAVGILVITGVTNAVSIVPISAVSFGNRYFDLLLVKVTLAAAMISLAALNRWQFAPAVESGRRGAVRQLTGSISAEIGLGVAIVTLAAFLGLMGPH
jgi:putative copper resistance protein D